MARMRRSTLTNRMTTSCSDLMTLCHSGKKCILRCRATHEPGIESECHPGKPCWPNDAEPGSEGGQGNEGLLEKPADEPKLPVPLMDRGGAS